MIKKKLAILIITGGVITLGLGGFKVYDIYSNNKTVKEFKTYIGNYKNEMKNYTLEKDQQETYRKLLTKADQIVNLNCKSYIDTLENELINFDKLIKESNLRNSKEDFNKVTNIDISNLDKKTQEKINNLKQETQKYMSSKKFAIAKQKITEINRLLNEENKISHEAKEQIKKEIALKENNLKVPNIDGEYLYKVLNKYGVEILTEHICISKLENNKCTFEGGRLILQRGKTSNGKVIPPEDVTKEMYDSDEILTRGRYKCGILEYEENNLWTGFIYCEDLCENNGGDRENPKIPCTFKINGNKSTLSFSNIIINYIKQ